MDMFDWDVGVVVGCCQVNGLLSCTELFPSLITDAGLSKVRWRVTSDLAPQMKQIADV